VASWPEPESEVASWPEPEVASWPEPEVASWPEPEVASWPEPEVASWPEPQVATPPHPAPAPDPRPEPRSAARWVEPGALAAQQAQRARTGELAGEDDLDSARLLRPARRPSRSGWRRVLFILTGGLINFGRARSSCASAS